MNTTKEMVERLEQAISEYVASPAYETTKRCLSRHFFKESSTRVAAIEDHTLEEIVSAGASGIGHLSGVGQSKIESIIEMLHSLTSLYSDARKTAEEEVYQASLEAIVSAHEGVERALNEISSHASEQRKREQITQVLEHLLAELRQNPRAKSEERKLQELWPQGYPSSSTLGEMSIAEAIHSSPLTLAQLPGVGSRKLEALVAVLAGFTAQPERYRISFVRTLPGEGVVGARAAWQGHFLKKQQELREAASFPAMAPFALRVLMPEEDRLPSALMRKTVGEIAALPEEELFSKENLNETRARVLTQRIDEMLVQFETARERGHQYPACVEKTLFHNTSRGKSSAPASLQCLGSIFQMEQLAKEEGTTPLGIIISRLPSILAPRETAVLILTQGLAHKYAAKALGVSESRISQIISSAEERLLAQAENLAAPMLTVWEEMLRKPAIPETHFVRPFLDPGFDEDIQRLAAQLILRAMGANHPQVFANDLSDYWTKEPVRAEEKLQKVYQNLPLQHEDFRSAVEEILPQVTPDTFKDIVGAHAIHVEKLDIWAENGREALVHILKEVDEAMSTQELLEYVPLAPRTIRAILRSDERVVKHGTRKERRYSIAAGHESR